jgi:hypothetical protein
MANNLRSEILSDANGIRLESPSLSWELAEHGRDLFDALSKDEPAFADVYAFMKGEMPIQKQWAFGTQGVFTRPDRHVRAFYLELSKLQSKPGKGCIAIKGSEPNSENFHQIVKRMGEMWNVFSWSIGGGSRHILEDWTLLNQLERFPLCEGKPPAVHPMWDAEEEATCALELQTAYFRRFGKLAKIPTPLFVVRWPDAVRDRAWQILKPTLSEKTSRLVESQIEGGLGTFVYYYPSLPLRAMHLRGGDVGPEVAYDVRHKALAALSDPKQAVEGWIKLTAQILALGWVPTDPANFSRGYCVMPQNLVIDGGIVDVNSLRAASTFPGPGQLEFAVRQTVRELTQSVCWYLLGSDAGLERFQHIFIDALVHVWQGIKKELDAASPSPEVKAIFAGGDGVFDSVDRVFRNFYGLSTFRPQDAESKEYRK